MKDAEFFAQALGLAEPWRVKSVRMEVEARRVEVELECGKTAWGEGGERLHIQGYEERTWRHLDTMQFETVLKARVPRVKYLGWACGDGAGAMGCTARALHVVV